MMLRDKIDGDTLEYLDSVAQVVAGLYEEQDELARLGQEVSELRSAVYTLGQAYMLLYNAVLDNSKDIEDDLDNTAFVKKWITPHTTNGSVS